MTTLEKNIAFNPVEPPSSKQSNHSTLTLTLPEEKAWQIQIVTIVKTKDRVKKQNLLKCQIISLC